MMEIWKEGKTSKEGNAEGIWKERNMGKRKEIEEYGKKDEKNAEEKGK